MNFRPHLPSKRRFLYMLLAIPVVLLLAAISFVWLLQSDYLRNKLSSAGSSKLGREFSVAGPLDVQWGWQSTIIHAEGVQLSNAPGLKEKNMLEIASIDLSFRPARLLFGRLELPDITVNGPKLVLEKTDEKTKNWDFPLLSSGHAAASTVMPTKRGNFPIIGQITINDGTIIYRDHTKDLDVTLQLANVSGSGSGKKKPFLLSGKGTLSGQNFTINATGGSLVALRDTTKDYPLKADIVMGPTVVNIEGVFKDPLKLEGVDTSIKLKGKNLADLFYLTSIPLPPTPAYDIEGRLSNAGKIWSFDLAKGRVGKSDLKASGTYDASYDRPYLKANLVSQNMNMDDLGGLIGLKPQGNQTVAPKDRLFPDVPLNLDRLRKSDLDVTLNAKNLNAPGWPFQSLDVHFLLNNGLLKIDPLNATIADGKMSGQLTLDGRQETPKVDADILLRRLSFKQFFGATRFAELSGGHFGGRIILAGSGKSLADVLGSSKGRISVMMAGGQVSLTLIEAAGLDVAQITPLLFGKDKTTRIRCAIGDFGVTGGLLESDVFIFDTNDSKLEGQAAIDLKNETIKAQMESHPKDVSLLAARTPITINGPLKKPSIGINPGELALKGGAAAALALINPLAAFIPFIDPGDGEDADCRGLIREVRARNGGADLPGPVPGDAPAKTAK